MMGVALGGAAVCGACAHAALCVGGIRQLATIDCNRPGKINSLSYPRRIVLAGPNRLTGSNYMRCFHRRTRPSPVARLLGLLKIHLYMRRQGNGRRCTRLPVWVSMHSKVSIISPRLRQLQWRFWFACSLSDVLRAVIFPVRYSETARGDGARAHVELRNARQKNVIS